MTPGSLVKIAIEASNIGLRQYSTHFDLNNKLTGYMTDKDVALIVGMRWFGYTTKALIVTSKGLLGWTLADNLCNVGDA